MGEPCVQNINECSKSVTANQTFAMVRAILCANSGLIFQLAKNAHIRLNIHSSWSLDSDNDYVD